MKTKSKALLSVLLSVIMLVGCFSPNFTAATRKTRIDNDYLILLTTGKAKTTKIVNAKSTVKWKIGNKKVAKITKTTGTKAQTVTVKAVKPGKTTLTATVGKQKFKCKIITVKPNKNKVLIVEEGKCYHSTKDCWSLRNSDYIETVTMAAAVKLNRRPCKICYE